MSERAGANENKHQEQTNKDAFAEDMAEPYSRLGAPSVVHVMVRSPWLQHRFIYIDAHLFIFNWKILSVVTVRPSLRQVCGLWETRAVDGS